MATPGAFSNSTISERIKLIPDAIINKSTVLKLLKEKGRMMYNKGGSDIRTEIRSSASSIGGSTSTWSTSGAKTTQPFTEATWSWRQYKWMPVINDFQVQLNENSSVMAKLFQMAEEQMHEVEQDASGRFETHAYGDGSTLSTGDETSSTPIDGFESIISTTGTYGNIARSGNTFWQAQVTSVTNPIQDDNNNDLTNLYEGMQQNYNACSKGRGSAGNSIVDTVATDFDEPENALTTDTLYRTYWTSLTPFMRYGPADKLKGGVQGDALQFANCTVSWDQYCTASRVYFINWKHLQFWCAGKKLVELAKTIEKEAPVSKVYVLLGQCQFICTNPRYEGAVQTSGT